MHIICLTIGRNVGSIPLPEREWGAFRADAISAITPIPHEGFEAHLGTGAWGGVSEDSYKVSVLCAHQPSQEVMDRVQAECATLAAHYRKDAIALTIGWSTLIQPAALTRINDQEVYA